MSALIKFQEKALDAWYEANPWAASRGIDEPMWNALCQSIYPGAKPDSIIMAVDYCKARKLDIMLKPVHLVPMQVKDAQSGNKNWRDVPMPGIGMYRIQASRSGDQAGHDEPEFGPTIEQEFDGFDWNDRPVKVKVRYPEWCKYTVYKVVGTQRVAYTAKEFWLENYTTQSAKSEAPNAMWKKRPFAQLSKCAEAQALRKGWPEIGQEPTAEEMEGKQFYVERDITPKEPEKAEAKAIAHYPAADFDKNFEAWSKVIRSGNRTADDIINMVSSKGALTDEQKQKIKSVEAGETA